MGYGQTLTDTAENETEDEGEEQQQQDDEQYDTVPKFKLVYDGKRVKRIEGDGKFKWCEHKIIMANLTPNTEMQTKVIYSFNLEIYRDVAEIVDYSKTLT